LPGSAIHLVLPETALNNAFVAYIQFSTIVVVLGLRVKINLTPSAKSLAMPPVAARPGIGICGM